MEHIALAHPWAMEIAGEDGAVYCGADQDWYRREWQRRAGCGPTTASALLCYLARTRGLSCLGAPEQPDISSFTDFMELVWEDVTPGLRGLNKTGMFTSGVEAFTAREGVPMTTHVLEVPGKGERPDLAACISFLRTALEQDCPVAFLNLDNGQERRLDKWHWVLITALDTDGVQAACTIADGGKKVEIDLALWHRTAKDLGGFVYAVPPAAVPLRKPRQERKVGPMKQDIMTDFIRRVERDGLKLAGVAVMQHGEYLGEHRWLYDAAHRLYSLSKSYTATAVGMAVDEGLLKLTDRPMDLFPEALPEHPDPALESLTLRHLLTMASGHDRPYFLLGLREHVMDPDWVRYYLAQPFPYRPGEKFAYDTGTTYVAAAMVEKVSGQKLVDFLMPRLFEKFGIPRPIWLECPMGRALGGDGLHLKTREVLPLGQLYLQKGVWQGERLLSEEFVREATRAQIDNFDPVNAEKPDWISGYGYQFWICQNGAYRGDGAGSQFCIVDEKLDAVIAITADDDRGQDILNAVWETLYPRLAERV